MPGNAYDTAWYARLAQKDEPFAYKALDWLRANQLPDGTWGTPYFYYAHDRIVSTLAAMTTLGIVGNTADQRRIKKAAGGLAVVLNDIAHNFTWELAGFEVIAPSLMMEAKKMRLLETQSESFLPGLMQERNKRMRTLNGYRINNQMSLAYSAEIAGDNVSLLDVDQLLMQDGSVYFSPAATAYYYLHARQEPAALAYLQAIAQNMNGAMPNVYPFAVFERAWSLWNLALVDALDAEGRALCTPILDKLERGWEPLRGVSFTDGATPDGDDTSLTFAVLHQYGRSVGIEALLHHFVGEHMQCNAHEANPSISTNIHALGAFRQADLAPTHPIINRIVNFLHEAKGAGGFWLDKWHISPYYATSHAVITASGYVDWLVETAVSWIAATQRDDGSWGTYLPTAEETAYAIQALAIRQQMTNEVHNEAIKRGANWLLAHRNEPHPPLWVGKVLYSPTVVNESAVLSALWLAEQIGAL